MDISLVLPIYGAEDFLKSNLDEINQFLSQAKESWELILVNDASPDRSQEICAQFGEVRRSYPVKILSHAKNLGKGAAVRHGLLAATGTYRLFNDCDLAYPMSEVLRVLEALKQGSPIAIASRSCSESRYIFSPENFRYLYTRHISSRALNALISHLFLPNLKDTQAGLKGFHQSVAKFIFSQLRLSGFSFDLELLHIAHQAGIPISEVPIHFYAQRVSTVNFPLEVYRMARDLCKIYYWTLRKCYSFHFAPDASSP